MEEITLAGYASTKDLLAQLVTRGGKSVYIVSLPIQLIPVHLAIPDPTRPIELNRQVSKSHAEAFGDYWLKYPDSWTVPPLLVDCPSGLEFVMDLAIKNGPKIGRVKLPDYSNQILRTLDGQHRILGWHYIRTKLLKDLEKAQEEFSQAARTGTEIEKQLVQDKLDNIYMNINRLESEQVTLEIITGVTEDEHKKFFTTIADNAQGINTSERTRLDETNMTSRVAKKLVNNIPLLTGRVEERRASVGKGSKDLLSLANLRDVVRHTSFGIKGKVTMAREQQISDQNALDISQRFFTAMCDAVPALNDITDLTYLPKNLRQDSLLGSATIWRCLAGAYNELAVNMVDNKELQWKKSGHDKFVAMLSDVYKKMKITTDADGRKIQTVWAQTDCFNPGEAAPRSRSQDLRNLSALFAAWAESGTPFQPKKMPK